MLLPQSIGSFEKSVFLFLLVYLVGLSFLTPPFQVADENAHFYRAVQLSQFEIFPSRYENTVGGNIPGSLIESADRLQSGIPFNPQSKFSLSLLHAELQRKVDEKDTKFIGFPNTALYSPIPYLFTGSALWLLKKFSLPPPLYLYLARVTNSLFAVTLVFIGLMIFPSLTFPVVLLSFIPMFSFQMASTSADSVMFGLAVVYCCSLARAFTDSKSFAGSDLSYFIVSTISFALLVLCKQAYVPLGLPLAVLLFKNFKDKKLLLLKLAVALFVALPVFYWNYRIQSFFTPTRLDVPIDPGSQLRFIISSPKLFIELFLGSVWSSRGVLWQQMIGVLGWLDTWLNPKINDFLGFLLLASVFMVPRPFPRVGRTTRLLILNGIILSALLVVVLIYMSWNPPGYLENIDGLQGRYFLPLLPFAFLIGLFQPSFLLPKSFQWGTRFSKLYVLCFVCLSLWTTVSGLLKRYYI